MRYTFVRARQLEGTFPGTRQTGTWPTSALRVSYGWGAPPLDSWPYRDDWPPIEPAGIDSVAKNYRVGPYMRVRSIAGCKDSILSEGATVRVSLNISNKWANPPGGRIPPPSPEDISLPTHHVPLVGYDRTHDEFKFANSWGRAWGDKGFGYISSESLGSTWWEGWKLVPGNLLSPPKTGGVPQLRAWTIKNADGTLLHWLDIVGKDDERLAWASALEDGSNLELEELFVRPAYRKLGNGVKLIRTMHEKAKSRQLSLRLWIPFSDTAPHNLWFVEETARRYALRVEASGVRWAPLVALPVGIDRTDQIPTFEYPVEPPSSPHELARIAGEVVLTLGTSVVSRFIYNSLRSWLKPSSGKKIRARLGDLVLETSEVSPDEFMKLIRELQHLKDESEIRSKIQEAGIVITIIGR